MKYLDNNGLIYLWSKVKSLVLNSKVTKTSELTNDSNFVTDANYVHTDNNLTNALVTKINNAGDSSFSGSYNDLTNKPSLDGTTISGALTKASLGIASTSDIPTNNNQLTNGAGYQTASQVNSLISSAIAGIQGISYSIVATLPATGEAGVIYLISNSGSNSNVYDEYIYVNNGFEKIGTTDIDLTGFVQTTDLVAITNNEIDTIVAS